MPTFVTNQLSDFITSNTVKFFDRFNISKAFLTKGGWPENEDVQNDVKIINKLEVHKTAERCVELMQDCNQKPAIKKREFQNLLQFVKEYSSQFPLNIKKFLIN